MSSSNSLVKWAQRKDKLFVTIEVTDSKDVKCDFTEKSFTVTGTGVHKVGQPASEFKTHIELSDKIDPAKSTFKAHGFCIQVCAVKAETDKEHWSLLTAESTKLTKNWLSVDWTLWKDEDEEVAGEKVDFGGGGMGGGYGDMASMMGGGGGMPGMPGMGGGGGMGGMDMNMLQQMMGGAGGGAGGAGGGMPPGMMEQMMAGGAGGGGEGEADSDDEAEPPNLEDVEGEEKK